MEVHKAEMSKVNDATDQGPDQQICELGELQLSLVGGGSGDVVFH